MEDGRVVRVYEHQPGTRVMDSLIHHGVKPIAIQLNGAVFVFVFLQAGG